MNECENSLVNNIQEIIYSKEQIQKKVEDLGNQISKDYQNKNPIFIGVLKGVFIFMADLIRNVDICSQVDFMAISSYSGQGEQPSEVKLVKDLDVSIRNRHVIFVEDVIDTGLSLHFLLKILRDRSPQSLEVCVLFDKPAHRLIDIPIRYRGFELPDRFVVGYGMDHKEKFRNLNCIGLLKAEKIHSS